jgi:hypothetical protein
MSFLINYGCFSLSVLNQICSLVRRLKMAWCPHRISVLLIVRLVALRIR